MPDETTVSNSQPSISEGASIGSSSEACLQNPPRFIEANERILILLFCLAAAMRVFFYSAAFPVFSNNDEQRHIDVVIKYSRGHIPQSLETMGRESAGYFALYGSPEFVSTTLPQGIPPPPVWTQPMEQAGPYLAKRIAWWQDYRNAESTQPPLYYALAGCWMKLGRLLRFEDGRLLYWTRFLNMFVVSAMVVLGYLVTKKAFPENRELRLGVALLLAFMPQDAFYSVENDVLSPVAFGWLLWSLLRFWDANPPRWRLGVEVGLAMAATYLVKPSNAPQLAIAGFVVLCRLVFLARSGNLKPALPAATCLGFCAVIPIVLWMAWCVRFYGDLTGSEEKIRLLSWIHKPFAEWWSHPVFTPAGFWTFWSENMSTFWRGEFWWHGKMMGQPAMDNFYVISSLALPLVAFICLCRGGTSAFARNRAVWIALATFAATVLFYVWLSISFDFNQCPNPSREHPYFAAGRLLTGALVPFALVYVYGLDCALRWTKRRWPLMAVLAGICALMVISEILINRPAWSSPYNWFHLMRAAQ